MMKTLTRLLIPLAILFAATQASGQVIIGYKSITELDSRPAAEFDAGRMHYDNARVFADRVGNYVTGFVGVPGINQDIDYTTPAWTNSFWTDSALGTDPLYICRDNTNGAAVWDRMLAEDPTDGTLTFTGVTDTDIVHTYDGTTNDGTWTWMEDEGTFVIGDDTGAELQFNYPFHVSLSSAGKGIQIGEQDQGDVGDHPSFLSMSHIFTADTGKLFRGIHNECTWQAENTGNLRNAIHTTKFSGSATYTQATVGGITIQLESDNPNLTLGTAYGVRVTPPTGVGGGAFQGTLGKHIALYVGNLDDATANYCIYTVGGNAPAFFGGSFDEEATGAGLVNIRDATLPQLGLEYADGKEWHLRVGSGGSMIWKNDDVDVVTFLESGGGAVIHPGNAISGTNVDVSELAWVVSQNANNDGEAVGVGFRMTAGTSIGAAIIHERIGSNSQGGMHFATKPDTGGDTDIPIRVSISSVGLMSFVGSAELAIPSGTSLPGTTNVGSVFLDTDAGTNGTIYCYANGGWRAVVVLP